MPVYEYRCSKCSETFEMFIRSFTQQKTPTCPRCGSAQVEKAVSLFGTRGSTNKSNHASCAPSSST